MEEIGRRRDRKVATKVAKDPQLSPDLFNQSPSLPIRPEDSAGLLSAINPADLGLQSSASLYDRHLQHSFGPSPHFGDRLSVLSKCRLLYW